MKLEYNVKRPEGKFDLESWMTKNAPKMRKSRISDLGPWVGHYEELIEEFRDFLNTSEDVTDETGTKLTPNQIYNAIEYYKIRIQKVWQILDLKMYLTYNLNKVTGVRYIVYRCLWIDDRGQPYKRFSKNLGAENKILVNGKIPDSDIKYLNQYMTTLMLDLYAFEYFNPDEVGIDEDGEIVIPPF
jgi:hypothetical protein